MCSGVELVLPIMGQGIKRSELCEETLKDKSLDSWRKLRFPSHWSWQISVTFYCPK